MADIICQHCGYKTFEAYALKDDSGKLICPQCRVPYKEQPIKEKRFKFKENKSG